MNQDPVISSGSFSAIDISAQECLWASLLKDPIDMEELRAALAGGADANRPHQHPQISPLEAAVEAGCLAATDLLVMYGADLAVTAVEDGRGLLHRVISSSLRPGRLELFSYLMKAGCDPDVVTEHGQSVREWAIMWEDQEIQELLASGSKPVDQLS